MNAMTPALAARMILWTVLIVAGYAVFVYAIARFCAWLGSKYPQLYTTSAEYYGVDVEQEKAGHRDGLSDQRSDVRTEARSHRRSEDTELAR
jgi:hypothetical protein